MGFLRRKDRREGPKPARLIGPSGELLGYLSPEEAQAARQRGGAVRVWWSDLDIDTLVRYHQLQASRMKFSFARRNLFNFPGYDGLKMKTLEVARRL